MRAKLTDRLAATVEPTPGKIDRYFDIDTRRSPRGFLLRVTPKGARVWALRYRVRDSYREREITIGDTKSWPIAEARKEAHKIRREVDAGRDPIAEREEARGEPTVAELAARFIEEALSSRAPGTANNYKAQLRDWVLPQFGRRRVVDVSRDDIETLHRKITATGKLRQANAVKSLCSVLFTQAVTWRMRDSNPCVGVTGNRENNRERFLSGDELERLIAVLDRWADAGKHLDSVDLLRMAILTGGRRAEIAGMRWADVDLESAIWSKPATRTKQRKPHRVPLSPEAVAVLRRRQAERTAGGKVVQLRDDTVFRGGGSKTHMNYLERDWYIIRAAAGLEDVRIHDLRHSFASMLVGEGLSLPIIGAMLGHSKAQTTQRYAHLADKPLREAAGIVGKIVGKRR